MSIPSTLGGHQVERELGRGATEDDIANFSVVLNWFGELRARMSTAAPGRR